MSVPAADSRDRAQQDGSIGRTIVAYVATLVAFCALDFAWLSVTAPRFYQAQLGSLLRDAPMWQPGALFYLLYALGILHFCVQPARRQAGGMPGSHAAWPRTAWSGAFLGLVAYGTYDLSNLATLNGWSTAVTMVDMAWGALASALAATCGLLSYRLFTRERY